jgi:hypothetical protein
MGHIVKRGAKWQAAYRGPDRRERTKTFARKVDAQAWLLEMETQKAKGTWHDPAAGLADRPPASVEDYNEMGQLIPAEEIAAVEAESLAFHPPED